MSNRRTDVMGPRGKWARAYAKQSKFDHRVRIWESNDRVIGNIMAVLDGQAGLVSDRIAQNLRAEFRRNWPGASHLELNELINQAIEGATEWGAAVELLLPRMPDNRESWNEPPAGFNPP